MEEEMKIIKCCKCNEEVSSKAKKCPNCGKFLKTKKVIIITIAIVLIIIMALNISTKVITKIEEINHKNQERDLMASCIGGNNTNIVGEYTHSEGLGGKYGETNYSINFREDYICELYYNCNYPMMNWKDEFKDIYLYKIVGEEYSDSLECNVTYIELYDADLENLTSNLTYQFIYYQRESSGSIYHCVEQTKNNLKYMDFGSNTLKRKD